MCSLTILKATAGPVVVSDLKITAVAAYGRRWLVTGESVTGN